MHSHKIMTQKGIPPVKKGMGVFILNKKGGVTLKKITREMLKIYRPLSGLDWMNYRLVRKDVTAHHIVKREDGGKLEQGNIALLMPVAHQYLHLIEYKDIETYNTINKVLKYVNEQGYEPTSEQRDLIEYLLKEFEKMHKNDKNAKGKTLIQWKYKQREW